MKKPPDPPPRYDDVFFEGVAALNKLASPEPEGEALLKIKQPRFHECWLVPRVALLIQHALKSRGWSQNDLAMQLGVSKAYVSALLRQGHNLSLSSLVKIADALDYHVSVRLVRGRRY